MRSIITDDGSRLDVGISGRFDGGPRRVQIRSMSTTTDLSADAARGLAVALMEQASAAERRAGKQRAPRDYGEEGSSG